MITKDLHAHSVLFLHQEKSLHDHELAKGRMVTGGKWGRQCVAARVQNLTESVERAMRDIEDRLFEGVLPRETSW